MFGRELKKFQIGGKNPSNGSLFWQKKPHQNIKGGDSRL
jgi:hypothetical protein